MMRRILVAMSIAACTLCVTGCEHPNSYERGYEAAKNNFYRDAARRGEGKYEVDRYSGKTEFKWSTNQSTEPEPAPPSDLYTVKPCPVEVVEPSVGTPISYPYVVVLVVKSDNDEAPPVEIMLPIWHAVTADELQKIAPKQIKLGNGGGQFNSPLVDRGREFAQGGGRCTVRYDYYPETKPAEAGSKVEPEISDEQPPAIPPPPDAAVILKHAFR